MVKIPPFVCHSRICSIADSVTSDLCLQRLAGSRSCANDSVFLRLRYTKSVKCNLDYRHCCQIENSLGRSNPIVEMACPPANVQNGSHHHRCSKLDRRPFLSYFVCSLARSVIQLQYFQFFMSDNHNGKSKAIHPFWRGSSGH